MESLKAYFENVDYLQLGLFWGQRIIIALLIFVVGRWIARWVASTCRRIMNTRDMDVTLVTFLGNLVYAILLTAVVIGALDSLGLPVTSLVAVLGAAGLAIGLALKDSLGNFAAGVMLVMFRPFTRGDFVEVAGTSGKVDEVRIFSTILTTPDNKLVIIPNGQVAADTITNYTALDKRRVDLVFGVGYDDDLKVARSVLERICRDHPLVLDDPETNIFVANLGDSSVDFNVRPWCKTDDYWAVYGDLLEAGKVELEAAGCSIPYPQRDVHTYHHGGDTP
jgi:small conductance mechanosensitive channel